jgi:hypothetical protein
MQQSSLSCLLSGTPSGTGPVSTTSYWHEMSQRSLQHKSDHFYVQSARSFKLLSSRVKCLGFNHALASAGI